MNFSNAMRIASINEGVCQPPQTGGLAAIVAYCLSLNSYHIPAEIRLVTTASKACYCNSELERAAAQAVAIDWSYI